jgi:hypothetical protein
MGKKLIDVNHPVVQIGLLLVITFIVFLSVLLGGA